MHRGHRPAIAVTARRACGLRTALSLFTVIPAGAGAELGEGEAAAAVLWLPAVGLLLGGLAAGVMLGVAAGGDSGPRRLLGAVLAVGLLALLTGGLHLDGLADTVDGLGSHNTAAAASPSPSSAPAPAGMTVNRLSAVRSPTARRAVTAIAGRCPRCRARPARTRRRRAR